MLARQTLLNCGAFHKNGNGCGGGETVDVFQYMHDHGLPDESCQVYNATDHKKYGKHATKCPAHAVCMNCMPTEENGPYSCWAVKRPIMYYVSSWGVLDKGEEAMISEIYNRGPIVCGIACPENFTYNYHAGVWKDDKKDKDVDHDVEVVGWGEENGTKYWLVRNSWGTFWGGVGFFKLERGVDALQIESGDCWYGEPDYQMEQDVKSGKLVGSMFGVYNASDEIPSSLKEYAKTLAAQAQAPRWGVRKGRKGGWRQWLKSVLH